MIFLLAVLGVYYAAVGAYIGLDIAHANRTLLPRLRLSPWLRGAFWPVFVGLGIILALAERPQPRR